jgi:hypothetical protein
MYFDNLGDSVETIGVTSLRGRGQAANNPAERSTYNYHNPEPNILWTWQFNREVSKIVDFVQNFETKISYYEPGEGHKPVGAPIHISTFPISAEGSFVLRVEDNEAIPNGPFRDLDIVVEAKDIDGKFTSSNGFKDTEGYDILGIRNSPPETLNISELDPVFQTVGRNTSISFSFKNFELTDDRQCYRGFIVISSNDSFTADSVDVNGGNFRVHQELFLDRRSLQRSHSLTANNVSSAYAGIVLLDDFDLKFIKSKTIGFGEILPNQVLTDSYLQRKIFTTARMPDVVELVRRTI